MFNRSAGRPFFLRTLCLTVLLVLLSGPGTESLAAADSGDLTVRQLQRLQRGLATQEALAAKARLRERKLQTKLAELQREMADRRQNLQELGEQINSRRQRISDQQNELLLIAQERERAAEHLRKRLVAAYRMGSTGLLNVLFTARSLPELLDFQENIQRMIAYDHLIMVQYRHRVAELEQSGRELRREEEELQSTGEAIRRQKEELARAVARHAALLRQVRNEKSLYQQAQREIAAAAAKMQETLSQPPSNQAAPPYTPPDQVTVVESPLTC